MIRIVIRVDSRLAVEVERLPGEKYRVEKFELLGKGERARISDNTLMGTLELERDNAIDYVADLGEPNNKEWREIVRMQITNMALYPDVPIDPGI